jgi:hypothetical protein
MATRYVEAASDPVSVPGDNGNNVRKIGVDTDTEVLKFYDKTNSSERSVVTTDQTQTLTNKTLTSPTITGATLSGITPISVTGAATFGATHVGRTSVLNAAAGGQIDLPAATGTGNKYRAVVGTALTSAAWVFRTSVAAGDRFTGGVNIDDTGDTAPFAAAAFFPAGASDEVLTLAFAATLGTIGAWVEFEDFKTGLWVVTGYLGGSVDPATPWGVATT